LWLNSFIYKNYSRTIFLLTPQIKLIMSIKALIIDDETRARSLLRGLLTEFCPDVEVVGDAADLPSGVKAIRKLKPNLVFLDIEMPGFSGLELLDFFDANEVDFDIVFATAYDQYALRAFKLSAIDYLLKPIDPAELERAVQKVVKKRQTPTLIDPSVQYDMLRNISAQRIALPTASGIRFLDLDKIMLFRADGSYTEIITETHEKIVVSRSLKSFTDALEGNSDFFRVQRSYIINCHFITEYVKSNGGFVRLGDRYEIPIQADRLKEFLDQNLTLKRH
jgi:two-component system, LytTR family, response regulator